MELNFVQSSEVFGKNTLAWETEFEATGDFNLHVERNKGGDILVYQRTAGSGYAIVEEFKGMDNKPAIDLDFTSVVYPKFVKIVSESQPTYATITTDGEITEIKSQSKEIEVTSNGTMDITPDAGFSYLNSVKVKTNVPTSGEGSGSASGDNSKRYFDISSLPSENARTNALIMASYIKQEVNGAYIIGPLYFIDFQFSLEVEKVRAICCDTTMPIMYGGNIATLDNAIQSLISSGAIEINREEFYNPDVPKVEE